MYLPALTAETDLTLLHNLIRAHPLGAWIRQGEDVLAADHIPFLLDPDRGPCGTLLGHVARANPVWRTIGAAAPESLVIFQGSQSYITPSWYAAKTEHGKVVPTWNYAVVHAHGTPRVIDDRHWLRQLVTRLTEVHEAGRAAPWQVSDAPADYLEGMLAAIVGIEIPLARITGKWKVSRNRPAADRHGVADGLLAEACDASAAMAALVRRGLDGRAG